MTDQKLLENMLMVQTYTLQFNMIKDSYYLGLVSRDELIETIKILNECCKSLLESLL